jgi:hypothetical protein
MNQKKDKLKNSTNEKKELNVENFAFIIILVLLSSSERTISE